MAITYSLTVSGNVATKEQHEAAINNALAALEGNIADVTMGVRIVGEWDASSGDFPTTRPDASAIEVGDAFEVSDAGTVDSEPFAVGDRLVALVATGGATYDGNWQRVTWYRSENDAYADRASAAAASIPAPVQKIAYISASGLLLEFVRDASGDALTTADGATWSPAREITPLHWGEVDDDSANAGTATNAALDYAEGLGGGDVVVPWPDDTYNLGTTTVLVPNKCRLIGLGVSNILDVGPQFSYSGTGVAFAVKNGEADDIARGLAIENIGVEITGSGATGFRVWRTRDLTARNCAVRMGANNQIGFHVKAERDGGTRLGVFDCLFERLISYDPSGSLTGCTHYKLSGTLNDGQVIANVLNLIGGGGSGKFCELGPSEGNTFIGPEAEALTDDYFDVLDNANNNKVFGGYIEAQSGWTGKVVRCTGTPLRNDFFLGTVGVNADLDDDLDITAGNRVYWSGRTYTGSAANAGLAIRLQGSDNNEVEISAQGIAVGDGTSIPLLFYAAKQKTVNTLTLASSVTPDADDGHIFFLTIDAATNPTLGTPTNVLSGDSFIWNINNTSGGARTLTWNASYSPNSEFPTTLGSGERLIIEGFRQGGTFFLKSVIQA